MKPYVYNAMHVLSHIYASPALSPRGKQINHSALRSVNSIQFQTLFYSVPDIATVNVFSSSGNWVLHQPAIHGNVNNEETAYKMPQHDMSATY